MYTFTERVLVHPSVHPPKIGVYFSDHAAEEALGVAAKIRFEIKGEAPAKSPP